MRLTQFTQTKVALGGDITLTITSDHSPEAIDQIYATLWHDIYVFERSFSRFIPKSELSLFNRSAGPQTQISPEFQKLLTAAKQLAERTEGLYNPFILPALQRAGYKKSAVAGYESDTVDDYSHRQVVSIDQLKIGDSWASIPVHTALDMGGCGKGYLADQLSQLLKNNQVDKYRLALGGDIATLGTDENGKNWEIFIQDADNLAGQSDWVIRCPVEYFAIATSGTFRRQGQYTDRNWHHVIDPTTHKPATTDIRLATVCADTALVADVLASCVAIVGSRDGIDFLKKQHASGALLQSQDESGISEQQFGHYIIRESNMIGSNHA